MRGNEDKVKREVTLHADRSEVWQALTEPALVEQWLADEAELDLREGGDVVFRYRDGEERRGTVHELIEEERLWIRWRRDSRQATDVEFVLADAAAGTRLLVVESVVADAVSASARAWEGRLFSLEVLALSRGAALLHA